MAEELRVMENKSREDANTDLSPVCKIEIYSFSILLVKIVSKYRQSYQN